MKKKHLKRAMKWLLLGKTGLSSRAIVTVWLGSEDLIDHPHDPSDFLRCVKMLAYLDFIDIKIMRGKSPEWTRFVDRWGELNALLDAEYGSGVGTQTYALMKEIIKGGECDEK